MGSGKLYSLVVADCRRMRMMHPVEFIFHDGDVIYAANNRSFSRVISFEDQVGIIRQHLSDIYEREQNWRQAAQVLVGIPLETGQKQYGVDYKLETYLKIARLYLEDEDPTQGEAYINRAAQLQTQTKNAHLQVIYKVGGGAAQQFNNVFNVASPLFRFVKVGSWTTSGNSSRPPLAIMNCRTRPLFMMKRG